MIQNGWLDCFLAGVSAQYTDCDVVLDNCLC